MKKLIPFLVSGILVVGIFGCQDATKTGSETPGTTNEAVKPAKDATQKTETATKGAADTDKTKTTTKAAADTTKTAPASATGNTKSLILSKLEQKIPGSKLEVEDKAGAVTIKGTVPTEADIKKIEPLVKQLKGVKSVKVEAKAASAKPQ
ncbi:BON domain-containing protein [Calothrix sp. PCC 7507]|uniref:BON domain-containing protein n=1 Tax=Calothrix sp. PCC 7507 TaxID=99598 RepID=UPI00029F4929|nr:BON domain-containing protein [Calothrix sp. PCC 7507]AFY34392.1 transport-associated protein [Calothrix sp. PCC 7507]